MFRDAEKTVRWLALILCLCFLKWILFIYDSDPQGFFGDSGSYLTTALEKWIPRDRSFVYGFLVRFLTQNSHSLNSLVAAQTAAGIATALLVALILTRMFNVRFVVASIAAILVALEPQQLLYERFVLTESFSTAAFAAFVLLSLGYIRRKSLRTLLALQAVGVVLVAFRVTFVPVILTVSVVAPALAFVMNEKGNAKLPSLDFRRMGIHLLISVVLFLGFHDAYKRWNGSLSNLPPAYSYADGFFLLSNVAPLVKAGDTDNPSIAKIVSEPLVFALDTSKWNVRNAEMFNDEGLVPRIQRAFHEDYQANAECKRIARNAILRDPVGFAGLAMESYFKFFDRKYMANILQYEAATSPLSADELKLLGRYHLNATELASHDTVTRKYHLASLPYYILLLHTPLVLLVAVIVANPVSRKVLLFLLLIGTVQVVIVQVLGVEPSPRHNHAVAVLLAIGVGVLIERFLKRS